MSGELTSFTLDLDCFDCGTAIRVEFFWSGSEFESLHGNEYGRTIAEVEDRAINEQANDFLCSLCGDKR